ncbi:MAG: hypothetical protein EAZ57_09435 [Cytophagales bacterium]|nr:MAG: hypothetical protein EAZ67_01535 [Cytophagales bacterium]TAF59861.1 MAG: hypothetical protein EAZ57_09435 [Cytophagales bacterium]
MKTCIVSVLWWFLSITFALAQSDTTSTDSTAVQKAYMAAPEMSAASIQVALPKCQPSVECLQNTCVSEADCHSLIASLTPVKKASSYLVLYTFNEGDTAKAEEYQKLDYKVRLYMVLAGNRLEELRNIAIEQLVQQSNSMTFEQLYDTTSNTFRNTQYIDELKDKIFYSRTPPIIQTHSIGINYPSIKHFGINPKQGAKGYRLSLGKNYALFVLDLQYDGKKALIWDAMQQRFIAAR